ncbi:MAG: hypothetical protein SFV15_07930 [Polyangiaceae bacterium]|nr:hypothetical protein [Polyangiaceae bacterium]
MTGQSLLPWGVAREAAEGLLDNRRIISVLGKDPYHFKATLGFETSQVHLRAETSETKMA